jgi:hypothetical protein
MRLNFVFLSTLQKRLRRNVKELDVYMGICRGMTATEHDR